MRRWVCVRRTVKGDPAAIRRRLTTETAGLLQVASGSEVTRPAGDGTFPMTLHGPDGHGHRTVDVTVGQAVDREHWLKVPVSWRAHGLTGGLFPTFEGAVELEDADSRTVTVAVVGTYHPPASVVGAAIDAMGMSRVAEEAITHLAIGLAKALGDDTTPVPVDLGHQPVLVADVMTPDPLVLTEDTSLRTAANLLLLGRISGNPVVDDEGRVVGVLSESDLLDKVAPYRTGLTRGVDASWRRHDAVTVGEACTRPARTTAADATIRDAAAQMARHRVGRLVVMQGATVVGIVTRRDAIRALARTHEAILDAVMEEVGRRDEPDLHVQVDGGMVRLTGKVERLSTVNELTRVLAEVEGVLHVDADELHHRIDDVTTLYPPI